MAKPIRDTPILIGEDADKFIAENSNIIKITEEERLRIWENAESFEKFADFND